MQIAFSLPVHLRSIALAIALLFPCSIWALNAESEAAYLDYTGESLEAICFSAIDSRVVGGITRREWRDRVTLPGWIGRAGDRTAEHFQITHGTNGTPGIQLFVEAATHRPIALGSLVNSDVPNALLAVSFRNATGEPVDALKISVEQVQWYGGTGAAVDRRHAWYGKGGEMTKLPELDLANFVADARGGLLAPVRFERQSILSGLAWQADEILVLRWVDVRVPGGNAGAGLASLRLEPVE